MISHCAEKCSHHTLTSFKQIFFGAWKSKGLCRWSFSRGKRSWNFHHGTPCLDLSCLNFLGLGQEKLTLRNLKASAELDAAEVGQDNDAKVPGKTFPNVGSDVAKFTTCVLASFSLFQVTSWSGSGIGSVAAKLEQILTESFSFSTESFRFCFLFGPCRVVEASVGLCAEQLPSDLSATSGSRSDGSTNKVEKQ